MQRLALTVSELTGWRRNGTALLAGALSVLAMAPFHLWPVMFVTLPVLVWLLDGCYVGSGSARWPTRAAFRAAAVTAWFFGFGYFLAGLYWIGFAFLVEAEIFAWLLPFAVTIMPAGLALFTVIAVLLAGPLWRPGPARLIALAVTISASEWLRGNILTGFPWNVPGYALTGTDAMMQWASVLGVTGLTPLAVMILAAPAAPWTPGAAKVPLSWRGALYPFAMAALLAAAAAWGSWRLHNAPLGFVPGVTLRLVQPSIPQREKWAPEFRASIFRRYMQVSRKGARQPVSGVTHVIWPESALPFLLAETPEALDAIDAMLPDGTALITGQIRAEPTGGRPDIYNSLFVMDARARVLTHYDKTHLVPFGEFLPLQGLLESIGLEQLVRLRGGFAEGSGSRYVEAPGLPRFIALICYEIIFPNMIRESGPEPEWMLNLTNDAWFGDSIGPHQHFHQARVRAVEQGLPLVRAANNGITAVTDPYGRVVARLPRNAATVLDSGLPRAAPKTVFVRWGGALYVSLMLALLAAWFVLGGCNRAE